MSIEAMKLALDALGPTAPECCGCAVEWEIAITALRQAIEQAQQAEPVAYSYTSKITGAQGFSHHPLPRFTDVEHWDIVPLYTTPPQRKPLSDEEIKILYAEDENFEMTKKYVIAFARAIEAAHGIKEKT